MYCSIIKYRNEIDVRLRQISTIFCICQKDLQRLILSFLSRSYNIQRARQQKIKYKLQSIVHSLKAIAKKESSIYYLDSFFVLRRKPGGGISERNLYVFVYCFPNTSLYFIFIIVDTFFHYTFRILKRQMVQNRVEIFS